MRLVFIGDVCYKSGRKFLAERLKDILNKYEAGFCVVNGENAAGGKGINLAVAKEILVAGADVITTGNHIWAKKEVFNFIESEKRVLRPLNYHKSNPGRGYIIINKDDVLDSTIIRMPKTYPAYFGSYDDFHIIRNRIFLLFRNTHQGKNKKRRNKNIITE